MANVVVIGEAGMYRLSVTGMVEVPIRSGIFRNGLWILDYNGNYQWDRSMADRAVIIGEAGDDSFVMKGYVVIFHRGIKRNVNETFWSTGSGIPDHFSRDELKPGLFLYHTPL